MPRLEADAATGRQTTSTPPLGQGGRPGILHHQEDGVVLLGKPTVFDKANIDQLKF
ncbi:hypothetical protein [Streptomyces sp. LN549]|uniref:hypothetical protein n=1 Tax=Streptomyces sp. LN549 TaxID=3112979 RepID=UPI003716704C